MRTTLALLLGLLTGAACADSFYPQQSTPGFMPMSPSGMAQAGTKMGYSIVQTQAGGSWTSDLTGMGCTTTPVVSVQPVSADATLSNSASASLTTASATTASGFIQLPNQIAVGGSPVQRAGTGLSVHVIAICR